MDGQILVVGVALCARGERRSAMAHLDRVVVIRDRSICDWDSTIIQCIGCNR